MNLKEEILKEHSKNQAVFLSEYIGSDQKKFDELISYMLSDESVLAQRAAYTFSYTAENDLSLVKKHLAKLIAQLKIDSHNAVHRNILRILSQLDIPEKHMGMLTDICFNFLINPKEVIALRAFSMEVLYKITLKEPDLAEELVLTIKDGLPFATAAYKSKAKKIIKDFTKRGWIK